MKTIKKYAAGIIMFATLGAGMIACTKSFDEKTLQQKNFNNSSLVQVYFAVVNASRNYVYMDAKLLNGGGLLTSGSVFPSTGYAANIPGGQRNFLIRDTLSTTTQAQLSFAENFQPGRNYTIFVYDSINAPKQKTVQTNIEVPTDTTARLRFANFTHTKTAITGVDLFSKRLNQNLFTNINITDVTGFIPYPSLFTDTLYVRPTGNTSTNLATLTSMYLNPRRSYTVVFRGSYYVTSGSLARTLSVFNNH